MKRPPLVAVCCTALALTYASEAPAQARPDCAVVVPGFVAREIECRVGSSGSPERLRFNARFSGSHDDTRLSMEATLDAKPVACDERSVTASEGEDGDITLQCGFALAAQPGARILRVKLRWYHAEYGGFDLVAE